MAKMVKVVYCIRKKSDVSAEEFYRRWSSLGPVVKKFAKAMKAVRYVQSHTMAPEVNAGFRSFWDAKEPYDGVSEVWYNSLEEMLEAFDSDEMKEAGQAFHEEEKKFIDFSESSIFVTEEHVIF